MRRMIIDGGTTNLRVYLLDAATNQVLAEQKKDGGVRYTAIDGHNGRLIDLLHSAMAEVLAATGTTQGDLEDCIAYGMITSGLGLLEIPHVPAPASAADLGAAMVSKSFSRLDDICIRFIPGVRNHASPVNVENCSGMDMMRGEETETIGLHALLKPTGPSVFVLPGTHNKFVKVDENGRILGCMTSISGELLDVITHHTILSDAVAKQFLSADHYNRDILSAGARECAKSGLGRAAFAGRILNTLGKEPAPSIQNWLMGAVLAEDVKAMQSFAGGADLPVYVAGKSPLQTAFLDVMQELGLQNGIPVDPAVSKQMGIQGALTIGGA